MQTMREEDGWRTDKDNGQGSPEEQQGGIQGTYEKDEEWKEVGLDDIYVAISRRLGTGLFNQTI